MAIRCFLSRMSARARVTISDERGSGAVEAVIVFPVLFFLYCAVFVWFDAYRDNTLAMKATYTASDIISRESEIDEPYIDGLATLIDFLTEAETPTVLRVSMIEYNLQDPAANKYRLRWSYGTGGKEDLTQEMLDLDSSWIPVMGDDETVIVTETSINYASAFNVGIGLQTWENVMVMRPRFTSKIVKTDEPVEANEDEDIDDEGSNQNPV
ncbi:MAG: pilus assembly protein [Paracoccaceae bacterium]